MSEIFINVPASKETRDEAKIQAVKLGITFKEYVSLAIREKNEREKNGKKKKVANQESKI